MVVPVLTAEQRAAALAAAAATRTARAELLTAVEAGDITAAQVLARTDPLVAQTRVTALIKALPGVGTVRAEQLITDLGIDPARRVGGLGVHQRTALLTAIATTTTPRTARACEHGGGMGVGVRRSVPADRCRVNALSGHRQRDVQPPLVGGRARAGWASVAMCAGPQRGREGGFHASS